LFSVKEREEGKGRGDKTDKRAEKGIRENGEKEIKVRKGCNGLRNKINGVSP